jgi:hypothetical protein
LQWTAILPAHVLFSHKESVGELCLGLTGAKNIFHSFDQRKVYWDYIEGKKFLRRQRRRGEKLNPRGQRQDVQHSLDMEQEEEKQIT